MIRVFRVHSRLTLFICISANLRLTWFG